MNIKKTLGILVAGVILSLTAPTSFAFAADYKIAQGDSLYTISQLFHTSVNQLKTDNKLTSDKIYPGQILNVPAKIYTIKSGDTLFLIAKNHKITLQDLRKANNKWNDLILPGEKLLIPSAQTQSAPTSSTQNTVISYTAEEVDLLARLITAEAKGESYEAKVAVGAVVVNRVQSSDWPNTISSVINQVSGGYYQFTPVKNGMINNPASDDSLKAAWAALYDSDPSKGAIFFFDKSSTNEWLWSKTVTAKIDSMVFVK